VSEPRSVFERHPVLTLGGLFVFAALLACIAAEAWLSHANPDLALLTGTSAPETRFIERHIRLRERKPSTEWLNVPKPEYLAASDGLEGRPARVRTDGDGFVGPGPIHTDPDLKIVFLGGSTTECVFLDEEERWPYRVGRELEALSGGSLRVNTWNGGVGGNNSMHSIDLLINKAIPLQPDVVVLMEVINDLSILLHEGTYWNDNPTRSLVLSRPNPADQAHYPLSHHAIGFLLAVKERTFPLLYERITAIPAVRAPLKAFHRRGDVQGQIIARTGRDDDEWNEIPAIDTERIARDFERTLQTFVDVARDWDIQPVLMTQANRYTETLLGDGTNAGAATRLRFEQRPGSYDEFRAAFHRLNDVVREVSARNHVPLIDLASTIPREPRFLYDTVHYSAEGSRLAASIIAKRLYDEGLAKRRGRDLPARNPG
jgi:lysophospholipase L1-like esterase